MIVFIFQEPAPWIVFQYQGPVVFYSLIGILLILISIVIWKYMELNGARRTGAEYAPKVGLVLKEMNWEKALNITTAYSKKAHLARIVLAGLKERERLQSKQLSESTIAKHMNQAMEREIITLQIHYRAGLGFVDAIGSTAPFIGALGGSAVTFATGTLLAIPTIWFATYFRNKTLVLEGDMKFVASELISYVEEHISE